MNEISLERIIASAGLPEGSFDSVKHPYLHIWLQSSRGRCRISLGYKGALPITLESCRGYRVVHDFEQGRRMNYVIFEETEIELREPFATAMKAALNQSLEASRPQASLNAFLIAVRDLKRLFGHHHSSVSAEELRGFMGELLTIRKLIKAGAEPSTVLRGWKAPSGSVRDFVFSSTHSLEVKSARPDSGTITISSISQLDQDEPGLQLAVWPLIEVSASTSEAVELSTLVGEIREMSLPFEEAAACLDHALAVSGLANYLRESEPVAYSVGDCLVFDVIDDFPRIRSGEVPSGVRDVSYTLRSSDLTKFAAVLTSP